CRSQAASNSSRQPVTIRRGQPGRRGSPAAAGPRAVRPTGGSPSWAGSPGTIATAGSSSAATYAGRRTATCAAPPRRSPHWVTGERNGTARTPDPAPEREKDQGRIRARTPKRGRWHGSRINFVRSGKSNLDGPFVRCNGTWAIQATARDFTGVVTGP